MPDDSPTIYECKGRTFANFLRGTDPLDRANAQNRKRLIPFGILLLALGFLQSGLGPIGVAIILSLIIYGLVYVFLLFNAIRITETHLVIRRIYRHHHILRTRIAHIIDTPIVQAGGYGISTTYRFLLFLDSKGHCIDKITHATYGDKALDRVLEVLVVTTSKDDQQTMAQARATYPGSFNWVWAHPNAASAIAAFPIVFAILAIVMAFQ